MRYRKLTPEGDYRLDGTGTFLVNTPEAVAQAVRTRMKLYAREWFLDLREGLDMDQILGYGTHATRDHEIQQRIIGTQGVRGIIAYSSTVDNVTRGFRVTCTVDTIYGAITIEEVIR